MPKPQALYDITKEDIISAIISYSGKANVYLSDSYYKTTTLDELKRFLHDDETNEYRYVSEYYDCDSFSFRLMGQIHSVEWGALPFGIVWTITPNGNHAVNCFVDNERQFWVIEPQNDSVFSLPDDWIPYLIII